MFSLFGCANSALRTKTHRPCMSRIMTLALTTELHLRPLHHTVKLKAKLNLLLVPSRRLSLKKTSFADTVQLQTMIFNVWRGPQEHLIIRKIVSPLPKYILFIPAETTGNQTRWRLLRCSIYRLLLLAKMSGLGVFVPCRVLFLLGELSFSDGVTAAREVIVGRRIVVLRDSFWGAV